MSRAIDADAFKAYIRGACKEMSHVFKDGGKWAKQITEDFCMDIDEQPTIEPERKKGKWILKPSPDKYHCGYVICPFCNGEYVETDEYNFCPNCGADMR